MSGAFRDFEAALERFEDALDDAHEPDCPMMSNHKGAFTTQDYCACWVGGSLAEIWAEMDWMREKLRGEAE